MSGFHDLAEPSQLGLDPDPAEPEAVRQCMVILRTQFDEDGFIPSLVFEGEAGHYPMMGNGPLSEPWHWGPTYEDAAAVAAEYNARNYGLSEDDVQEIIVSSMFNARSGQ